MSWCRKISGLSAVVLFLVACGATAIAAEPCEAWVVRLGEGGRIDVEAVETGRRPATSMQGVVVWSAGEGLESWCPLTKLASWPPSAEPAAGALSSAVRGESRGSAPGTDYAGFSEVVQLEQLSTGTVTRAAQLVSPRDNAEVLQPQVLFRRLPEGEGDKAFPARVATVYEAKGNREAVRVRFSAGQAEVAWRDVAGPSTELAAGLPPGRYILRMETAGITTEFTVLTPVQRQQISQPIDDFAALTGGRQGPLATQFAVVWLLKDKDDDGTPTYLTDAWMLLAGAPEESATPHLKALRAQLLGWLERLARVPGFRLAQFVTSTTDSSTSIPAIDNVRGMLAAGRWDDALGQLEKLTQPSDAQSSPRAGALAELYRAVILAESGLGREQEAAAAFERALERLGEGEPADLYRGLVNYGNFLLHQAQDRLDNLSFQMAAGVRQPLLSALRYWMAARQQYETALDVARKIGDRAEVSATEVNLARLYALLADVIRTLDATDEKARQLAEVEAAAVRTADGYASQVADAAAVPDAATRAMAQEIRAHLAFRRGDFPACRKYADAARDQYTQIGRLAGVESVARLLGLVELTAGDSQQALRQFLLSQSLAELLRERFPPDQVGLSRAGFFARRSYVYERIVELLIASGKPAEALRYAELAKARAAQDFLAAGGLKSRRRSGDRLSDLLGRWPQDTAALEYFLGSRRGWVFAVTTSGQVQAVPLADATGRPIASRELIGRVRKFLSGMENQAVKMSRAIMSGRGFDHAWQSELHALSGVLVPEAFLSQLRGAKTVVLVPHHILHYFPFAALVTKTDPRPRSGLEMCQPTFLLDEPFQLVYAPSLATWDLLNGQPRKGISQVSAVGIAEVPGAPPLPGVTKDLENLRAVFGDRIRQVYEAGDARESRAKEALRQRGLLLLATHGFNDPDQPLESHLLFLPEEQEVSRSGSVPGGEAAERNEGRLTAREIFSASVRAEMVVMNACYSGLSDRSPMPGDDLFGLQRAFLQSGTRTVVSGLWDVYDGTAPQLMQGFFRRVESGSPPSAALAESQREFLRELRQAEGAQPWLHPYFWAVFTVAGADGKGS